MYGQATRRSWLSVFSFTLVLVLVLSLAAACGEEDDEGADVAGEVDVTETEAVDVEETEPVEAEATEDETEVVEVDEEATPAGADVTEAETAEPGAAEAAGLAACLQDEVDGEVVTDLRAGETETADAAFRGCLEQELPPGVVAQLDPIIEQATACATDVAEGLSEDEVAAIEEGDQEAINEFTTETVDCLSEELGIELS